MVSPDENPSDYFAVAFRIIGDSLDPLTITELLGLEPDKACRKGDPNVGITKKGKEIHYAPFRTGLWAIDTKLDKHERIQNHIESILECIEPKKEVLTKMSSEGLRMEFFCGHFFTAGSQARIILTNEVLKRIADLGIDFRVEMYAFADNQKTVHVV